ncbi:MAG TPA: hypothetical protein VGR73_17060 [Bryobacteraceae bacterium]|nr:hypothetical protein [Bryobacteraceae bacterium]
MRRIALILLLGAMAGAQSMTEFGAVAAGSTVGGAGGKAVSDGINNIFGKVGQQTVKAAGKESPAPKESKETPALTVAPGVPRDVDTGVPAPPPEAGHPAVRKAPAAPPTLDAAANTVVPVPFSAATIADAMPAQPIPPPPTMTPEALKQVTSGMSRADVLKLGDPASKLAMFEDGHYVETFSYRADGQRFGRVRLQDGAVVTIETQ